MLLLLLLLLLSVAVAVAAVAAAAAVVVVVGSCCCIPVLYGDQNWHAPNTSGFKAQCKLQYTDFETA